MILLRLLHKFTMFSHVVSKLEIELSDEVLSKNMDWDPSYMSQSLSDHFFEFYDLWVRNSLDMELFKEVEKYSPIVKDISMDDQTLCTAMEKIENE